MENKHLKDVYHSFHSFPRGIFREESLNEPLPAHKILSVNVYDEFVDADIHEHNWEPVSSMPSVSHWGAYSIVFKCKSCGDMANRTYIERL